MDFWGLYCDSNNWIMNNLPPITDYHHIYIQINREEQFAANLEFYGERDYDFNNYDDEYISFEDNFENENDYFSDNQSSSSDSEYDEFEYN